MAASQPSGGGWADGDRPRADAGEGENVSCLGIIPNTFILCGEDDSYCSDECLHEAFRRQLIYRTALAFQNIVLPDLEALLRIVREWQYGHGPMTGFSCAHCGGGHLGWDCDRRLR